MEDGKFYENYLGLQHAVTKNGIALCRSEMRDLPLNRHFVYKMLVTDYEGRRVLSLSNEFAGTNAEALCREIAGKDLDEVYFILHRQNTKYRISFMYRMLRPEGIGFKESLKEEAYTEEDGLTFVYKQELRKQFAILHDDLIGYAKISDIYDGYGNVVIWVEENYRQHGIATILLHKLIQRCEDEGLIPMYLVKRENVASFGLASKFGFKIVHHEIVLCQEI